ncbi:MAG: ribonuclease P protein component [Alphaproteobacteria bacterium]|nr:ribonuclease P protein component [Alphaproteobacteria bacterium]
MTKIARLKRRAEFLAVAASRRKQVTPGLILQAAPCLGVTVPRVGFTASKKVGIAVARNRARRRLRAAAEQVIGRHGAAGHDFVLIARTGTLTRPFGELLGDLELALKRIGAYRADSCDRAGGAP